MSVSGKKDMKISCGLIYPVEKGKIIEIPLPLEKEEIVEMPSKTAGERKVPAIQNIQEIFDYITVGDYTGELDEKGQVVRRIGKDGKVLTSRQQEIEGV